MSAFRHEKPSAPNAMFDFQNMLMGGIVRALELAAGQEALAQEEKKLRKRAENEQRHLERTVRLDHVTGVHNRLALYEAYGALQNAGRRHHDPNGAHSMMLVDVDRFKEVNDEHGHGKGDTILKRVASIMEDRTRTEGDLVARIGGDEFAILLPRTDPQAALLVAEDIRERVIDSCKGRPAQVTLSIGISPIDLSGTIEDNMATADAALYAAKEQGRNKVVLFEPEQPQPVAG